MVLISLVVMIACIAFFVKAAQMEGKSALLWGLMSFLVWSFTPVLFLSYFLSKIGAQVLLFFAIAAFRVFWDEYKKRRGS